MARTHEQNAQEVRIVNLDQLAQILVGTPKGQFVTFTAVTNIDKYLKKEFLDEWGNGRIKKTKTVQTQSYTDYVVSARNEAKRNGDPEPDISNRTWGHHLKGTPFIIHIRKDDVKVGNMALQVYYPTNIQNEFGYSYTDTKTGEVLDKDFVHGMMKKKPEDRSKTGKKYREYHINGVVRFTAQGKTYIVADALKLVRESGEDLVETWKRLEASKAKA